MAITYDPRNYDLNALVRNEFFGELSKVREIYDGSDRKIFEIKTFPGASVGSAALSRTFQYDGNGNEIATQCAVVKWRQSDEDNANPAITDLTLSVSTVVDQSAADTVVATISTVGGTERYNYEIIADPSSKFKITGDDELSLSALADIADVSYNVTIKVKDGNGTVFQKAFVITVVTPLFLQNDKSLLFDGVDEYVAFAFSNTLDFDDTEPFTLSAWIKPTGTAGTHIIMENLEGSPGFKGYQVVHNGVSDKIEFDLISNSASANRIAVASANSSITDSVWQHVAITYDGSSTAAGTKIYIDSVDSGSTVTDALSGTTASTEPFTVGARSNAGPNALYAGNIDEVSVFNIAMNQTQINELYNSGTPVKQTSLTTQANLLHWWRMGDGDTSPTIDDKKGSLDGTMTNMEAGDIVNDVP